MAPIPFSFLILLTPLASSNQTYIVFMNPSHHQPSLHPTRSQWYHTHLQSLSIDPDRHLLYSYSHSLQGFSAHLLPHHLPILQSSPFVLSIVPDPLYSPHTTRSPHFLHLSPLAPSPSSFSFPPNDVIVGVLDTGVWPELPSFDDARLASMPSRWKGKCEAGVDFSTSLCNNKLIEAYKVCFSTGCYGSNTHRDSRGECIY